MRETRRSRPLGVVTAFVLAVASLAVGTGPASAAVTCGGQVATIVGTPGADTIRGTAKRDVIVTFEGNDDIDGRRGDDVICSGAGNDSVVGGEGNDAIWGGDGSDMLRGYGGNDRLYGEAGNDYIETSAGTDAAAGGDGDDMIVEGAGNDTADGGGGTDDTVIFGTLAPAGVTVNLATGTATGWGSDTLVGIENVWGTRYADRLTGNALPNALYAYEGDDVLVSGGGGTWTCTDPSQVGDEVECADVLGPGPGNDTVVGGNGLDVLADSEMVPLTVDLAAGTVTGSGPDTLQSVEGVDGVGTFVGNDADNVFVVRGTTPTSIRAGAGTDVVVFLMGPVSVNLAAGSAVFGGTTVPLQGVEDVWGTNGDDLLVGNASPNDLRGFAGDDSIAGGGGNDRLDGGLGTDVLDGGAGTDTCVAGESLANCEA